MTILDPKADTASVFQGYLLYKHPWKIVRKKGSAYAHKKYTKYKTHGELSFDKHNCFYMLLSYFASAFHMAACNRKE